MLAAVVMTASCATRDAASSIATSVPVTQVRERPPKYGLSSAAGGYRFDAVELADRGGQAIRIDLTKDGQPVRRFDGEFLHMFLIGEGLGYYGHEVIPADLAGQWLNNWLNVGDTARPML